MDKKKNQIWVMGLSVLLFACGSKHKQTTTVWDNQTNTLNFTSEEQVKTSSYALSDIMDIEDWRVFDTLLVCKNSSGNPFYYVVDINDFTVKNVFGYRGNGQNEWIGPNLLQNENGGFQVLDNGRRAVYDIEKSDTIYSIHRVRELTVNLPLNDIKDLAYPVCAYKTCVPNTLMWNICNIETLSVLDSISFTDEKKEGKAMRYDFCFDAKKGYAVLAGLYCDRFMIVHLDETYHLSQKQMFVGNGSEDMERRVYYTDVFCDDFIYLLSQRKLDLLAMSGRSQVEVYDYSGQPVKVISLDIVASKMIYDKHNKRFVFLSPDDNDLHVWDVGSELTAV